MLLPCGCGPLPRFWSSGIKIWWFLNNFRLKMFPYDPKIEIKKKTNAQNSKSIYSFLVLVFFQQNLLKLANSIRQPPRNLDSKREHFEPRLKMFPLRTQPTDLAHQRFLHQSREQIHSFPEHSKILSELL